ncbi:hypothetical protein KAT36_03790 [Candidatus Pacearchaeota archaeon]|nr:hypothetical protein [Candidatus Pacearchaeota archaeon]
MIDIQEKKRKILEFLKTAGPSLPVRIAKSIEMDPVFASAILSELSSSKQIITSHMKIGASPLYLLPDQKEKLEEKTDDLKEKEKKAQEKLKEEKVIFDEQEEPVTRVALRNIKDFAIPFKFKEKIAWKYAFIPQEEIDKILFTQENKLPFKKSKPIRNQQNNPPTISESDVPKAWEVKKEKIIQAKKDIPALGPTSRNSKYAEQQKKIESIVEKPKETTNNPLINKTLLKEIEIFLNKQNIKIISIEEVDKRKVIAITESDSKQVMLFAFNKKRINEAELLKCYKYARKANLPYRIITRDNPTKKMNETIDAYKKLIKIEKLKPQQP